MVIEINLKSDAESKVAQLIAFLKSIDFVENVKITPSSPKKANPSRFNKYNGIWKNKLSVEKIDEQLDTLHINS
jgi:hypothetical protein